MLIDCAQPLPAAALEQYWTASKCRLDRWGRALKTISQRSGDLEMRLPESAAGGVLEEILLSEVLTRVWTGVVVGHARKLGHHECESLARSVYQGHLEARHRVMKLLVEGPGVDSLEALRLNRLRRRAESWIDLLLARLLRMHELSEFAIDARRSLEIAEQLGWRHFPADSRNRGSDLLFASLRAAFRQVLGGPNPNADVSQKIIESILACFASEAFDSTGLFKSQWMLRAERPTPEAPVTLAELLPSPKSPSREAIISEFVNPHVARRFSPDLPGA